MNSIKILYLRLTLILNSALRIFLLILLLFLLGAWCVLGAEEINNKTQCENIVHQNKIYIKFKSNSFLEYIWKSQGKTGKLEPLVGLLGEHTTSSFIRDEILQLFYKYVPLKVGAFTAAQKTHMDNISNIAIVDLKEPKMHVDILVAKISKLDGVEYAETVPEIYFFEQILEDELAKEQEHLEQVKATKAWDYLLPAKTTPVVVAIVDTGIETQHIDLAENLWTNPGETGLDSFGNLKQNNGIDDDNNGFIDDYFGWDFYDEDNIIEPVHWHGTHVAGLIGAVHNKIGVAGVAKNIKLMAVKITGDKEPTDIERNGYEGILYAAAMGADIINCSWGGFKYSVAELEAVKLASTVSTIVAAAGNTNTNMAIYPARCKEVLNVAAVNKDDIKTSFSTYNKEVDVSAPGQSVLSTMMNNKYGRASGTSMASPIAAAVAAMVKNNNPDFTSTQVIAQVKSTADDISKKNPNYKNLLGNGRVNALNALKEQSNWIIITSYNLINTQTSNTTNINTTNNNISNNNIICDTNIYLVANIHNVLNMTIGAYAKIESDYLKFAQDSIYIADTMSANSIFYEKLKISSVLDQNTLNKIITSNKNEINIIISFYDSSNLKIGREYITLYLGLDWKHFVKNNIGITYANNGRFAYVDYPNNQVGYGMSYKNYFDLLYQSGIIVATDSNNVFSNITGENGNFQDTTLKPITRNINEFYDSTNYLYYVSSEYETNSGNEIKNYKKIKIRQDVFASKQDTLENTLFVKYTITNKSNKNIDKLYFSVFHDWEVFDVERNKIEVDKNKIVLVTNYKDDSTKPKIGVKLITQQIPTYKSISLSGDWGSEGLIYNNGFPKNKKWNFMKNILAAPIKSNTTGTDIAMLLGGYESNINQDSSVVFTFVITASENKNLIHTQIAAAENFYNNIIKQNSINEPNKENYNFVIYPNPVTNILNYEIEGAIPGTYTAKLVDLSTQNIHVLSNNIVLNNFSSSGSFEAPENIRGVFHLVFENSKNKYVKKFIYIK